MSSDDIVTILKAWATKNLQTDGKPYSYQIREMSSKERREFRKFVKTLKVENRG